MSLVFASRWSISAGDLVQGGELVLEAADVLDAVAAPAEHRVPPLVALLHREPGLFQFGLDSLAGFLQRPFDFEEVVEAEEVDDVAG